MSDLSLPCQAGAQFAGSWTYKNTKIDSGTWQIGEDLYVILLKGDRDNSYMSLVSKACTRVEMDQYAVSIATVPGILLEAELENLEWEERLPHMGQ